MPPTGVEQVVIEPVLAQRRSVLAALVQLYLHDFSEHAPLHGPFGEVDEATGLFAYSFLENYWGEAGRLPLLIRADGRIAGFILVNRWSALDRPVDHAVAEFFVMRKYRFAHVGTRAAHLLVQRWPGRWEIPVASYNQAAKLFWRRAIGALPVAVEEAEGDGRRRSGPVLCFTTA